MKLLILFILLFLTSCKASPQTDLPGVSIPNHNGGIVGEEEPENTLKILMPNGAPSLAQLKIEYDYKVIKDYKVEIDRVGDPKLLAGGFASETYDIIYAPINMGVMQYNKTKKYKMLCSITNGNTYFVSKTEINNLYDLEGKKLYIFGQGTINETMVNHLLKQNFVTPSAIIPLASTQDTLKQFVSDKDNSVFMIAEPILSTQLLNKNIKHYTLSINSLLEKENINYLQAGVFYKKKLNTKIIDEYYRLLTESIEFVNNDPKVIDYIKETNIGIPKNINLDIIKKCNIKLTRVNKEILEPLINLDPKKFGGAKPDETFYY